MSTSSSVPTCALPSRLAAWRSLISRSILVWDDLYPEDHVVKRFGKELLEGCHTVDDYFAESADTATPWLWFFQRREAFMSQERLKKWSADKLDDNVLLLAIPGLISRGNSFFVSHFWPHEKIRTREESICVNIRTSSESRSGRSHGPTGRAFLKTRDRRMSRSTSPVGCD